MASLRFKNGDNSPHQRGGCTTAGVIGRVLRFNIYSLVGLEHSGVVVCTFR